MEKKYSGIKVPKKGIKSITVSDKIISGTFLIYSLACILPLILVIIVSFTDENYITLHGYSFFPSKLSLNAYKFLFYDWVSLVRAYGITIYATIIGTLISLFVTSMFAYVVSRKDFKYRYQFSFFMFFTILLNGGLIPWYMMYTMYLHLKDNLLVFIVPFIFNAFNMLIFRTYFKGNIPDAVIESAKIDGATEFKIYFGLVIPLSTPVFATVALFLSLSIWNDWYISLLYIQDQKLVNLQYMMYRAMLNIQNLQKNASSIPNSSDMMRNMPNETLRMAMAIIGIGPIVLAYPYLQKYFIKGLTIGAVKG